RIFRNQTEHDWAVVNADDPGVLALAREGRARPLPFHPQPSASPPAERRGPAAFFAGDEACLRRDGAVEVLFPLSAVRLPGTHLAGDLLAAGAAPGVPGARSGAGGGGGEALGSVLPVIACPSLAEAVDVAWAEAEPGDTVLLAPACSSFDMFEDYAARGRAFKEEVHRLELKELGAGG